MENKPKLRKPLSRLGAIRITKKKAKIITHAAEAPNNYSIVMINTKIKEENKVGYIFYQDLDNFTYSQMAGQHQSDEEKVLVGRWKEGRHCGSNPRTRMDLRREQSERAGVHQG
eukprot:9374185-Heterocapsa_arctica.AAC.1